EAQRDPVQVRLREAREICSPREILSQQAVGVLVAAALPRTAWIAEIDLHVGGDGEVLVVSHLLASIPGQRAAQLLGQFAHVFTERRYYSRRVLARDFEKHHKARMALDQRRDVVLFAPERRSPSQWPGTARSSASAGRSRMEAASTICPSPHGAAYAGGPRAQQAGKLETRALFAGSQGGTVARPSGNTCGPL